MIHIDCKRGRLMLQEQDDGTVSLVVVPEEGAPAACQMEYTTFATLASVFWALAGRARQVAQTVGRKLRGKG